MKKIKYKLVVRVALGVAGAIVSGAFTAATGVVLPVVVVVAAKWVGAATTGVLLVEKIIDKAVNEERGGE